MRGCLPLEIHYVDDRAGRSEEVTGRGSGVFCQRWKGQKEWKVRGSDDRE